MNKISLLIILCIAHLTAFAEKTTETFDLGVIKDSVYTNTYFGLTIKIPSGWNIQNRKTREKIMDSGGKKLTKVDKRFKDMVATPAFRTANLLTILKHPIGTPNNISFFVLIERISHVPGIKRGKDYLYQVKNTLKAVKKITVTFPDKIYSRNIGGRHFDIMTISTGTGKYRVLQKQYTIIIKGYALIFIASYKTHSDLNNFTTIFKTIKLRL